MLFRRSTLTLLLIGIFLSLSLVASAQEEVTIRWLHHWGSEERLEFITPIVEAFEAEHPNINIEMETVPGNELLTKITTARVAGTSPDVYHISNLYMPELVEGGALNMPPEEVVETVMNNASQGSIDAVSWNDQIWGYPTELNTYQLIYNKRLLEEAGYSAPPTTWEELKEIAEAVTTLNDDGSIENIGFATWLGNPNQITWSFMALAHANGAVYMNEDGTELLLNQQEGVETLQLYKDMIDSGAMSPSFSTPDFLAGRVGMIVHANWYRNSLLSAEGIDFETEVGVANVPVGPSLEEGPASLSFNWLMAVDDTTNHTEEAWTFVQWMHTQPAEGELSPMGHILLNMLGAIPSMTYDQEAAGEVFEDHFMPGFVDAIDYATADAVTLGASELKAMLLTEIENVLTGIEDSPQAALDDFVMEGNTLLEEMRLRSE